MDIEEKRIDGKCVYDGKIFRIIVDRVELPNGRTSTREVVCHHGGVAILPITEKNEVIMVKQFRYPYMEAILEIPAGKLNKGEDPFTAGKRELREETGAVAKKYENLGVMYPSPGYTSEKISLYAATGLEFFEQNLDDDEFLNVVRMPFDEALNMVLSGEITDGKTQIAILKYNEMMKSRG